MGDPGSYRPYLQLGADLKTYNRQSRKGAGMFGSRDVSAQQPVYVLNHEQRENLRKRLNEAVDRYAQAHPDQNRDGDSEAANMNAVLNDNPLPLNPLPFHHF